AMKSSPADWSLERSRVSEQLKHFVAEKVAQARAARADGNERSPEFDLLLAAAENCDWPTMRDIFAKWHAAAQRWENYFGLIQSGETIVALEIEGAFEQFAAGVEDYSLAFGRDVIDSIPPGSVYFSGTDSARGVVTVLCKSEE